MTTSPEVTDTPTVEQGSAIYQHCCKVWAAMVAEATPVIFAGEETLMYEGFLSSLFDTMDFSNAYYSQVMNELKRMGSVCSVRRGGGKSPSRWALLKEPTFDLYRTMGGKEYKQGSPKSSKNMATMLGMWRDLEEKYQRMSENYNATALAMLRLENKCAALEAKVNALLGLDTHDA